MKNKLRSIMLILFTVFSNSAVAAAGNYGGISNEVIQINTQIINHTGTNPILSMTLENIGTDDLLISRGGLPWDRYAMTIVLLSPNPSSTPLQQELTISDPPLGDPWRLRKGQKLSGRINLADWFPSLPKVLGQTEVILFWSYQIETQAHSRYKRVGDWAVISISLSQERGSVKHNVVVLN